MAHLRLSSKSETCIWPVVDNRSTNEEDHLGHSARGVFGKAWFVTSHTMCWGFKFISCGPVGVYFTSSSLKMQMITSYACDGPVGSTDHVSTRIANVNELGDKVWGDVYLIIETSSKNGEDNTSEIRSVNEYGIAWTCFLHYWIFWGIHQ